MAPIEGITPEMLWTFLIVLVGLSAVFILGHKVVEILRKEHERKKLKQQPSEKLAEEISTKVLENLEPRFGEIDRKLGNDKVLLDTHSRQIEALNKRMDGSEGGITAIMEGLLALMDYTIHGGDPKEITEAQKSMRSFLSRKASK